MLDRLEPWRVELDTEFVDYRIEFDPPRKGAARPLPRIKHGSCDLVRLRDRQLLESTFLRILNAFGPASEPNQVRLALMPLEFDGRVLLVPPVHAGKLSHRWYVDHGITPWYSASSVVDVESGRARVDPPLGSSEPSAWWPIADWWLPSADPTAPLSPAQAVAYAMARAAAAGLAPDQAVSTLTGIAEFVARHMPSLAPQVSDSVLEMLSPEAAKEANADFGEAVSDYFGLG